MTNLVIKKFRLGCFTKSNYINDCAIHIKSSCDIHVKFCDYKVVLLAMQKILTVEIQ